MIPDPEQANFYQYKVNLRIILSALWICLELLYGYSDFFTFFIPRLMRGLGSELWGYEPMSQSSRLTLVVLKVIPIAMIFLSLVMQAAATRMLNVILGLIFTIIMILAFIIALNDLSQYHIILGFVEIVVSAAIALYAYRWPGDQ